MAVRRGLAGEEEEGGWEETEAMAAGECTCKKARASLPLQGMGLMGKRTQTALSSSPEEAGQRQTARHLQSPGKPNECCRLLRYETRRHIRNPEHRKMPI